MFEHINFIEHKDAPVNQKNITKIEHPQDIDQEKLLHEKAIEQVNYRFTIDGHLRLLFPPVPLKLEPEHFFYPQLFGWFECGASYYTRRSNYQSYEIVFTYNGEGYLEYEDKSYLIGPGSGFFIDCRKPHFYRTNGDLWEHSVLHFDGFIADKLYEEYCSYDDIIFQDLTNGHFQSYLESLLNIWDHFKMYKELQISNAISDIVTYLLVNKAMSQQSINAPETINYVTKYIRNNFSHAITLDLLASFSNISKYHLTREFKKYLGTTPIQYLISIRLANAKFMLIHTQLPVSVIAEQTGFTDINNFNRLFLKNVGMRPYQFRIQHRG